MSTEPAKARIKIEVKIAKVEIPRKVGACYDGTVRPSFHHLETNERTRGSVRSAVVDVGAGRGGNKQ